LQVSNSATIHDVTKENWDTEVIFVVICVVWSCFLIILSECPGSFILKFLFSYLFFQTMITKDTTVVYTYILKSSFQKLGD